MKTPVFPGGLAALAFAAVAQAQPAAPPPVNPTPPAARSAAEAETDASAAVSMFKPGMAVRDSAGARVGTIIQAGRTAEGDAAVVVDIDGQRIGLAPSLLTLTPAGDQALSSMTKAEIKQSAP